LGEQEHEQRKKQSDRCCFVEEQEAVGREKNPHAGGGSRTNMECKGKDAGMGKRDMGGVSETRRSRCLADSHNSIV